MARRVLGGGVVLGALALAFSAPGWGQEVVPPRKALEQAARAVASLGSVRLEVVATGGTAARRDAIRCDKPLVRRSYEIDLVRPIARVALPDPAFWRYGRHDGAAHSRERDRWVQLLAHPRGKELTQLVRPVEAVLQEAARLARRRGRWLDAGADLSRWQPGEDRTAESGHTTAREGTGSGEGRSRTAPTVLRVVGPWQVAERRIVHVQNSGCLSGG